MTSYGKKKSITILLILLFAAVIAYSLNKGPHEFSETDCFLCHEGNITAGELKGGGEDITLLCSQCHDDLSSEAYMHPVDIRPVKVVNIPSDLPLSPSGNITCNSCHDVHADYTTPVGEPSYFLRRYAVGKLFCDVCHSSTTSKGHAPFLAEAHLGSRYTETDPGVEIDALSKNCLSCHDGTYASSVSIKGGIWNHQAEAGFPQGMSNHPIGMDYEDARVREGRKTDLRPISMVDQRIMFFEGKVGCGSCHNPYTEELMYLVKEDRRSELCFSCHMIDK